MKRNFLVWACGLTLLCAACDSPSTQENSTAETEEKLPPVETKEPNTNYEPAFEGQTRAPGVKTSSPFEGKVIAEGLNRPWGIAALPDDRFLITEKEGTMRIVSQDGTVSEPITGLPAVNSKGQGGLLGVTLDPDFENNRMIFWTFSEDRPDGSLTAVAKGKLADDEKTVQDVQVIYRATPAYKGALHYGSRILFDEQGNIIFSTGERSDLATRPQAQDLNSGLGKIIRITPDGNPVSGNPFEDQAGARKEIYSYGHRNVQGLAFHPETGDLWEAEFGPRGGDEVNRIEPGKNYGWPVITYGIEYKGQKIGDSIQQKSGMEQPIYYYDPVISPSGITFYDGDDVPEWKNNLFIAALSGNHVARLIIEDNRVTGEERLLAGESQRFRAITQGNDEALYAVTDQGRLYRLGKPGN